LRASGEEKLPITLHTLFEEAPPVTRLPIGRRTRALLALAALAGFLALAGCSSGATAHRELTQRQRDSTLGRTNIPGASAVTHALAASDRAARDAAKMNAETASDTP